VNLKGTAGRRFFYYQKIEEDTYMSENKPTQFRVSDHLRDKLKREAARRGLSPSELARMLIAQGCNGEEYDKEAVNAS
jgi:predicted DNA binding CopG/RHH family protein